MASVLVSTQGRIVLPAEMRRRLGLNPGARLEVTEETDGLRLRLQRVVPSVAIEELAGLVTAPSREQPRKLSAFDPAFLIGKLIG